MLDVEVVAVADVEADVEVVADVEVEVVAVWVALARATTVLRRVSEVEDSGSKDEVCEGFLLARRME